MADTTKTRAAASNYVLLMRKDSEGNAELVQIFVPDADAKVPRRALTAFLNSVAGDTDHELYEDLVSENLFILSGHPEPVGYGTKPTLTIG